MNRIALIGKKLGMTMIFKGAKAIPVTVVEILSNVVLSNSKDSRGYNFVTIAGGDIVKSKNVNKPQRNLFDKINKEYRRKIKTFNFGKESNLNFAPGTDFVIDDFLLGFLIDVRGISKGKGFQGTIKRWNFGGMPASHGVSVTHRHLGSTGNRSLPGKVFKGKKMPGHMGSQNVCVKNLKIEKVVKSLSLIFISGSIPGANGDFVYITDSVNNRYSQSVLTLNGLNV